MAGLKFSGSRNIMFREFIEIKRIKINRSILVRSFMVKKFLNEILSLLEFRFKFLDEPI